MGGTGRAWRTPSYRSKGSAYIGLAQDYWTGEIGENAKVGAAAVVVDVPSDVTVVGIPDCPVFMDRRMEPTIHEVEEKTSITLTSMPVKPATDLRVVEGYL